MRLDTQIVRLCRPSRECDRIAVKQCGVLCVRVRPPSELRCGVFCSSVEGDVLEHGRAQHQRFVQSVCRGIAEGEADPDRVGVHSIVEIGAGIGLEEMMGKDIPERAIRATQSDIAVRQE